MVISGKLIVVGAGSVGRRHATNLESLGIDVELHPWRSFDASSLSRRKDISALVIATATPVRLELIKLCARNGWPFYVEKPLAWDRNELKKIETFAEPVADRSFLGFMLRYHPTVRAIADLDLSDIYHFSAEVGHDVRQWRSNWRFSRSYASAEIGGGVLLDLCHEIDILCALFGDLSIRDVRCLGHDQFPGVDFASGLHLTSSNGALGTVSLDYLSPVAVRKLTLCSTSRRIEADLITGKLVIIEPSGSKVSSFVCTRNHMFLDAMKEFLALASGAQLSPDPLRPSLSNTQLSSLLIATAWESRVFSGSVHFPIL